MTDIPDLARRISRRLETGKGMQLAADDLALLCAIGVNDLIQTAAADYLRDQCQKRAARSRSINGGASGSTSDPAGASKSSGTTTTESASEAAARALAMSKPGGLRLIAPTSKAPKAKVTARRAARPGAAPAASS